MAWGLRCSAQFPRMPFCLSVMSMLRVCCDSSFSFFLFLNKTKLDVGHLFDVIMATTIDPENPQQPASVQELPTEQNPFHTGINRLNMIKQICVIGLCDIGDVRFCRLEVENDVFSVTCRMMIC